MSNEIKIKVTSEADVKGIEQANKALGETALAAEGAGKATDKLGDNFTESDRKGDRLGRTIASDRDQLIKLDASIASSTASLKLFAHALADTDDAAQRIDIRKAMSKAQADLSSSLKAKKLLNVGDLVDSKPDPSWIAGLEEKLGAALRGGSALPILGGTIGAAMAPMLAATLSSAVTGAVGIGGIAGGVALVAKDPIIASKAKEIGATFNAALHASARQSFLGPVSESLDQLGKLADRSAPKLAHIFEATAPSVEHLTGNVTRLGDSLLSSLEYAAGKSGSSINALGDLLEHTGESVGKLISSLSDGADSGASAINMLDDSIQDLIDGVGGTLKLLAEVYGAFSTVNQGVEKLTGGLSLLEALNPVTPLLLLIDGIQGFNGEAGTFSKNVAGAADANETLANSADDAADSLNGQRDSLKELSDEMRAEIDPVFGLLDATDELKHAQDAYAKSVKKSGANSEESRSKLRDLAKASVDLEGKAGTLGGTFDGTVSPALRTTLEAAGWTKQRIDALGKEFQDAKSKGDAFSKTYAAKAKLSGTGTAIADAERLRRKLASIHDRSVYVNVAFNEGRIAKVENTLNRLGGGYAHGGIVGAAANGATSSGMTLVGEHGPELIAASPGSRVWSAGDSQRMMSGSGGGGDVRVFFDPSGADDIARALFTRLRAEVSVQGGGSVQRTFGQVGVS